MTTQIETISNANVIFKKANKNHTFYTMHAKKDFTIKVPKIGIDVLIKKGTVGGKVEKPEYLAPSVWLDSGCQLSGVVVIQDSYLSDTNSYSTSELMRIKNSFIKGAVIGNSNIVYSAIRGGSCQGSTLDYTNANSCAIKNSFVSRVDLNGFEITYAHIEGGETMFAARNVGSETGSLILYPMRVPKCGSKAPYKVNRGCFNGTWREFKQAVANHDHHEFRNEYKHLIKYLEARFSIKKQPKARDVAGYLYEPLLVSPLKFLDAEMYKRP